MPRSPLRSDSPLEAALNPDRVCKHAFFEDSLPSPDDFSKFDFNADRAMKVESCMPLASPAQKMKRSNRWKALGVLFCKKEHPLRDAENMIQQHAFTVDSPIHCRISDSEPSFETAKYPQLQFPRLPTINVDVTDRPLSFSRPVLRSSGLLIRDPQIVTSPSKSNLNFSHRPPLNALSQHPTHFTSPPSPPPTPRKRPLRSQIPDLSPLLHVQIPGSHLERYSVMFESILHFNTQEGTDSLSNASELHLNHPQTPHMGIESALPNSARERCQFVADDNEPQEVDLGTECHDFWLNHLQFSSDTSKSSIPSRDIENVPHSAPQELDILLPDANNYISTTEDVASKVNAARVYSLPSPSMQSRFRECFENNGASFINNLDGEPTLCNPEELLGPNFETDRRASNLVLDPSALADSIVRVQRPFLVSPFPVPNNLPLSPPESPEVYATEEASKDIARHVSARTVFIIPAINVQSPSMTVTAISPPFLPATTDTLEFSNDTTQVDDTLYSPPSIPTSPQSSVITQSSPSTSAASSPCVAAAKFVPSYMGRARTVSCKTPSDAGISLQHCLPDQTFHPSQKVHGLGLANLPTRSAVSSSQSKLGEHAIIGGVEHIVPRDDADTPPQSQAVTKDQDTGDIAVSMGPSIYSSVSETTSFQHLKHRSQPKAAPSHTITTPIPLLRNRLRPAEHEQVVNTASPKALLASTGPISKVQAARLKWEQQARNGGT